MVDSTGPQESWNMATATLQRLARILDQCSMYSQQGDLINWFKALMDLRRNLSPFLDDTEFKEVTNKFESLPLGWINGGKVNYNHYSTVNKLFDEIFIILIRSMKSKGILMPKQKDANKAVIDY
jgi:hypothetical protein